jgi:hypothetical protein
MTYGAALVLVALGAILRFAVADTIEGVDLAMIGLILMIVGAIGFVASLVHSLTARRTVVYDDRRAIY